MKDPRDTPAMRQFASIKAQHPDCVLFFRMGDFYELFDGDAVEVSKALGLTLTKRGNGLPMAGVPYHQLSVYLRKAIEAGFRVAVVDQVQDPKEAKGVVERRVTSVVTPGTLTDETLIDEGEACAVGAVWFIEAGEEQTAAGAAIELSTGAFGVFCCPAESLADELSRRRVRELLFAEGQNGQTPPEIDRLLRPLGASGTPRPSWQFRRDEAVEALQRQFAVQTLTGFGLDEQRDAEVIAAGALVRYLRETQAAGEPGDPLAPKSTLDHLRPPVRDEAAGACTIDLVTARALEIERTIRDGSLNGSLAGLFVLGKHACRTAMGKRLLRDWLRRPLGELEAIRARQRAVRALVEDRGLAADLREQLDGVQDAARIVGRLALARATPRDLVGLGCAVRRIEPLIGCLSFGSPRDGGALCEAAPAESLAPHRERLEALRATLAPLGERIIGQCVQEPPAHLREGGLFRDGVDVELDEARALQRDAGSWLSDYQSRLIAEHDLPSLKVGFNKVFGYFIELPAAQARRAPDAFTRKQTLKNAERYITPELREFEGKVTTAEARAVERENTLFADLCGAAAAVLEELSAYADVLGELDALLTFADKAVHRGWREPRMVAEPALHIVAGRHPVLDELLERDFVANDLELAEAGDDTAAADGSSPAAATLALITGPNMAGKSTYIRQNALLVLLAHAGSFVPAERATIGVCDRIFTRVGADDALHQGQSTFMVEMTETANILNHATPRSLVILDEIGRGTSTLDGLSLAWAIAERLVEVGCRTLFATHYHELTELAERFEGRVTNLHVLVREWDEQIIFLHSIQPGRADQSYGVHVARLAGVPREVTDRAREVLASLSVEQAGRIDANAIAPAARNGSAQLPLFTEYIEHPAMGRLRELKLESLSPMQAFDLLRELRELSQGETP